MQNERVILHCDLNNFYASVACLDNPSLKGMPVAVAGSVENRHGIILAKNYEAKVYGVQTGDTIREAESKCGTLILIAPNFKRQNELSRQVQQIYLRYTDKVEPFGVDECWLDVTGSRHLCNDPKRLADEIRIAVKKETGLTISVGVSFNKIFAKLGSDMKKPDAVTVISRQNFKEKVWPIAVSELFGVGRKTKDRLRDLGILTIGDLATCSDSLMQRIFGKRGLMIKAFANGEASSDIVSFDDRPEPKSVGRSVTTPKDIVTLEEAWKILLSEAEEITEQLKIHGLSAKGVQVHMRTFDLVVRERETTLERPTTVSSVIAKEAFDLLKQNGGVSVPLRSLGVRAINLSHDCEFQCGLFDDQTEIKRQEVTDQELFSIRQKFGKDSLFRATMV